ncbi:hypothetical protein NAD41_002379 [Salmonella enterica]|nr:hypothetical protein [Salmonella enterica]EKK6596347.1 hypothetical protein [Salmonella enterica]
MIPMFSTPRAYRVAGSIFMAVNIGNMVTFSNYVSVWADNGLIAQGIMTMLFHLATIVLLSAASGRLWADANKLDMFIRMMEKTGFVYDKHTKEFRPGGKF